MRKTNKKAQSFEIFNWFLLVMGLVLMIVALVSLYIKLDDINVEALGVHADNVFTILGAKEKNFSILDGSVAISTPETIFELGKQGAAKEDSLYYFNVPVFRKSDVALVLNHGRDIENNFERIFARKLNNKLTGEVDFRFNSDSISLDDDVIYGFSLNPVSLRRTSELRGLSVQGFWGAVFPRIDYLFGYSIVTFNPNFAHKIQGYSIETYKNALSHLFDEVFDEFSDCNTQEDKQACVRNAIRSLNQDNGDYEIFSRDRCIVKYNEQNFRDREVPNNYQVDYRELIYYDVASKIKACVDFPEKAVCEIKVDVPLGRNGDYVLSNIFLNSGNDGINISFNDFNEFLSEKRFFTARVDGMRLLSSELRIRSNSQGIVRDVTLTLDPRQTYSHNNAIYVSSIGGAVSFLDERSFRDLGNQDDVKVLRNQDLIDNVHYICIKDKTVQLPAKVGDNYIFTNPYYNFVLFTGGRNDEILGGLNNRIQ